MQEIPGARGLALALEKGQAQDDVIAGPAHRRFDGDAVAVADRDVHPQIDWIWDQRGVVASREQSCQEVVAAVRVAGRAAIVLVKPLVAAGKQHVVPAGRCHTQGGPSRNPIDRAVEHPNGTPVARVAEQQIQKNAPVRPEGDLPAELQIASARPAEFNPSDYPRTYRASFGWLVYGLLVSGLLGTLSIAGAWYFGTGHEMRSPGQAIVFSTACIAGALF